MDEEALSLRERMELARALYTFAGILIFVGFLLVAAGVSEPIWVLGAQYGSGLVAFSAMVPWGIAVSGLGVLLGFFGAATKGPSRERWEVPPALTRGLPAAAVGRGTRYACPGCGGDVFTSQTECPECGHALARRPESG